MSEELVVEQCSPTMAGLKTGNLFSCPAEEPHKLRQSIRRLNRQLVPCGIRLLPVKSLGDRELIYMYRPEKLQRDLRDQTACRILKERRYPTDDPERCVVELVRRLNREKDFPHEIGLFLGYPAEDVSGFIHHIPLLHINTVLPPKSDPEVEQYNLPPPGLLRLIFL